MEICFSCCFIHNFMGYYYSKYASAKVALFVVGLTARAQSPSWTFSNVDMFCVYELALGVHVKCYSSFDIFSICSNLIVNDPVDNTCYSQCDNNNVIICLKLDLQNWCSFSFFFILH